MSELRSINCTSCGAGLDVLGGGRVLSQTCGYCGATLDAQDNYKVLAKNAAVKRPETPFRLGDRGDIHGVPFTVIGTLGKREQYNGRVWTWAEHQVFSPTHGYSWISVEDGHLIWTRKSRDMPSHWVGEATVATAEQKPKVRFRGDNYVYYETTKAQTTFIEGEFNWVPKAGATTTAITFVGKDGTMTLVYGGEERELEVAEVLPPETWESFGVKRPNWPRKVHPAERYVPSPHRGFMLQLFGVCALIALVVTLFLGAFSGPRTDLGRFALSELPQTLTFDVQDTGRPTRIDFLTSLQNAWAYFEIDVQDPNGNALFETGRLVSFYSGGRGDDAWKEGSRSAHLVFQPLEAGPHTVTIGVSEHGDSTRWDGTRRDTMVVRVRDGLTSRFYTAAAFVVFLLAALGVLSGSILHQKRRMSGTDWTEED